MNDMNEGLTVESLIGSFFPDLSDMRRCYPHHVGIQEGFKLLLLLKAHHRVIIVEKDTEDFIDHVTLESFTGQTVREVLENYMSPYIFPSMMCIYPLPIILEGTLPNIVLELRPFRSFKYVLSERLSSVTMVEISLGVDIAFRCYDLLVTDNIQIYTRERPISVVVEGTRYKVPKWAKGSVDPWSMYRVFKATSQMMIIQSQTNSSGHIPLAVPTYRQRNQKTPTQLQSYIVNVQSRVWTCAHMYIF